MDPSGYNFTEHWPTPLYEAEVPNAREMNLLLMRLIRERSTNMGVSRIGMFNGAKSNFDLLRLECDEIRFLNDAIYSAVAALTGWALGAIGENVTQSMIAEGWVVEYEQHGYHRMHVHHGSCWSGVYYVSVGNLEPGAGELHLIDPRVGRSAQGASPENISYIIHPRDGLIVAFPSWLSHWVTPTRSDTTRTCIAFNVGFGNSSETT